MKKLYRILRALFLVALASPLGLAWLPPDRRYLNQVVLIGVHYAVIPTRSWSSFPLYLDDGRLEFDLTLFLAMA